MKELKPLVFLPPFLLMLAALALNFFDADTFTKVMEGAYDWVIDTFGWLVVLAAFGMLLVCVAIACSPFGRVVIGGPDAKPLLTRWQWFTIALCTYIAIGVLFWGPIEPIHHLSDINTIVMLGLLVLIFVLGPMRFVVGFAVEGFGRFLSDYPEAALFTGALEQDPWPKKWTMMHFSNWFAWAPISAVFLGRIAYGYTVRSFMLFNLVLPGIFTGLWMAIFAGTAIHMQLYGDVGLSAILEQHGVERAMYAFWEQLPFAQVLIPVFLVTSFLSFVTAADSNTSAMSGLSSTGVSPESPEPSMTIKIAWGVTVGLVAWVMMTFAHSPQDAAEPDPLRGIRMLSNLGGLPALLLCLGISICAIRVTLDPARFDVFHKDYGSRTLPNTRSRD